MFFQSWVHVDRVLFNVVNNRAVGDIVIIAGSSIPTEEEEDHDDNQRHEGGSADEGQDGCHVALNLHFNPHIASCQEADTQALLSLPVQD